MPCILKIRINEARDLPVMDRSTELADAYVEVTFGDITKKTEVQKKTLNPVWNEDFRIEVANDSQLQDCAVEFRVYDYDIVSANDIIGMVYVDLNPLLNPDAPPQIAGWFPIYDTLRGLRGDLNLVVKLEFFGNENSFKDNSAGVSFFSTSTPFSACVTEQIQGFVEELIVESDPEYHWLDNFRASRISNEERQWLLYSLSGKLRRQLGRKVLEMGGNAVLGYHQHFDFEGETGIVARGYGTSVFLNKLPSPISDAEAFSSNPPVPKAKKPFLVFNLSTNVPSSEANVPAPKHILRAQDVKLITLKTFQSKQLRRIGGVVMARSIKLLGSKVTQESRDSWWIEIREEVKSHALFLGCHAVVGYLENTTMDNVNGLCVLTAVGTAAVLTRKSGKVNRKVVKSIEEDSKQEEKAEEAEEDVKQKEKSKKSKQKRKRKANFDAPCSYCHIPYKKDSAPFDMQLARCNICKKRYVPEILLTTIEPPPGLPITGKPQFVETRVCRQKQKAQGEQNATIVSEAIPFLEYDLHRQLMYKLKLMGMNAAFGLKFQLSISESLIIGVASATAVFLPALPAPPVLSISRKVDERNKSLQTIQNKIEQLSKANQHPQDSVETSQEEKSAQIGESSSSGELETADDRNKAYVVEVDDEIDEDTMVVLLEPITPQGFYFCNMETLVGNLPLLSNIQMITAIRRIEWSVESKRLNQQFSAIFHTLYASVMFKLRTLTPCCLCALDAWVSLPDDNEVQIVLTAMVVLKADEKSTEGSPLIEQRPRSDSSSSSSSSDSGSSSSGSSSPSPGTTPYPPTAEMLQKAIEKMSPVRKFIENSTREVSEDHLINPTLVELTPMSFIPGATITKFLGRIQQHFIKESFTVREKGGLSGFTHVLLTEVNAVLRSHVASLGGNALICFRIDECNIVENQSKNQSYSLLSVSGDAVYAKKEVPLFSGSLAALTNSAHKEKEREEKKKEEDSSSSSSEDDKKKKKQVKDESSDSD